MRIYRGHSQPRCDKDLQGLILALKVCAISSSSPCMRQGTQLGCFSRGLMGDGYCNTAPRQITL